MKCFNKLKSHRFHIVNILQELPQQLWEIIQHDNSSAEILYALTLRQLMLHGDVQDFSDDLVGLLPLSCEFQLLDKNRQLLLDDLLEKSSHPNRSSATGLHSQPIYDLILIKNIVSILLLSNHLCELF